MPEIKNNTKIITGFIKNETYPSFKVSNRKSMSVRIPLARKSSVFNCNAMYFML